jgi:CelD/BcsL family acetyltransferase involved in cellulose biosynthesis
MALDAELISEPERLAGIEEEWRALAELRGNAFLTPEWFHCAREHSGASPLVAAARRGGELAGVMPMLLDDSRRPRAIRFAGADLGDRFSPAAREGDEAAVAAAAMRSLADQGGKRIVLLEHVESERPWWREMQSAPRARYAAVPRSPSVEPYIDLRGLDWEGYLASRSRNFRSQVRRRERALEREHGFEVRQATEATLEADLDALFRLHTQRWDARDDSSSLEAEAPKLFLRSFSAAALARGWLRLRLLEVDGVAVAGFLGWRLGDRYAFYQSGFDPEWSDRSVGVVMMATTIRSAIEEGASEFDMLLGEEAYKARYTNSSRSVETVTLVRAASPVRFVLAGEAKARRVGRRLAQRPALGRIARSLRRLLPTSREP